MCNRVGVTFLFFFKKLFVFLRTDWAVSNFFLILVLFLVSRAFSAAKTIKYKTYLPTMFLLINLIRFININYIYLYIIYK